MYIGPDRQLTGYVPAPEQLVDQLMKAALDFKHTRSREDLKRVIIIAQQLNSIGYLLIWDRKHGLVGCHRKGAPGHAVVS